MDQTAQIESYLLTKADWVKSSELMAVFDIKERALRAVGNSPGLCSSFAISGDKGFKHITLATTSEWLRFKHRLRKHGIAELTRTRDLGKRRKEVTRKVARPMPFTFEKDTGQGILI